MENNTIFFQCKVLNVEDPMMLGRIRGVRLIDNYEDILKSVTDPPWNEEKDIWTERDPLIFNPLLPYFVYSVPKVDELVQVMYMNKDFVYQNQYYIQNTFSSPTATYKEFYFGGNKFTGTGMQIKNPKPLKNQNGTLTDKEIHKGVFPEPGDNSILGRGSADLIVKQDEVLLRAGKFQGSVLQPNVIPVANQGRGFLQLSRFQSTKQQLEPKKIFELQENYTSVKYLVEWVITNPENTQDIFTGTIYLYQLKPDLSTSSKNLTVGSVVDEKLKTLVVSESFINLPKLAVIKFINDFLTQCNSQYKTVSGKQLFPQNNIGERFPIFYRPSNLMYNKLLPSTNLGTTANSVEIKNIGDIFKGVKLLPALQGGYGLIYAQNKVGALTTLKENIIPQSKFTQLPVTYGAIGADKLFLLSHNSQIPGKGKINFDDTLYGISQEKFSDEIIPKTSSLVRGEELLELINLIVRFLITHTHAYPGLPPVQITQDGTSATQILTEIQNAVNKILNSNIRLN